MERIVYPIEVFFSYKEYNTEPLDSIKAYIGKISDDKGEDWRNVSNVENNWVSSKKYHRNDEELLLASMRTILNKLSESNFDTMVHEFTKLKIVNAEQLKNLVTIIVDKAIDEHKFSSMYSKLCHRLSGSYIIDNNNKILFRDLLLNKAQQLFLKYTTDSDIDKNSLNGCVKFIGELYNANMLTPNIMYNCILAQLNNIGKYKYAADSVSTMFLNVKNRMSSHSGHKEIYAMLIQKIKLRIKNDIKVRDKMILETLVPE